MADENLSLQIDFEEIEKFQGQVQELSEEFEQLQASIGASGAEIDDAVTGVEELEASLDKLDTVTIQVDSADLDNAESGAFNVSEALDNMVTSSQRTAATVEDNLSEMEGAAKKLRDQFEKLPPAIQGIIGALAAFGGLQIVTKGFQALVGFATEAKDKFIEQEQSIIRLNIALGSLGEYSVEASRDMQEFASSLQRVTTFGDETILKVSAVIAQLGRVSGQELKRATEGAIQLSAVIGTDLQASGLLLAKAAQGMTESLSRYGLVLDESIPKSERFNALLDLLENNFGGAAQLQAETFGGKIQQLGNVWGDFLEVVGQTGQVAIPALESLTRQIQRINDYLGLSAGAVIDFDRRMGEFNSTFEEFGGVIPKVFPQGEKALRDFSVELARGNDYLIAFREKFLLATKNLEIAAKFTLQQGSVDEIQRVIRSLSNAADLAAAKNIPQIEERLRSLIKIGEATIKTKIEMDDTEARNKVSRLVELSDNVVPLEIQVFNEDEVRQKLDAIEELRPELFVGVELDEKYKDEIAKLESNIIVEGPELETEKFTELARETAKTFNEKLEEGLKEQDPQRILEAIALIPALRELERQRVVRIPIEWEVVGPIPDWSEIFQYERAQERLDDVKKLVIDAQTQLGKTPTEIIDLRQVLEGKNSVEELIPFLEEMSRELGVTNVQSQSAKTIWEQSNEVLGRYTELGNDAADAITRLGDAARSAGQVTDIVSILAREIPGLADDMKNFSTSTDKAQQEFDELNETLKGVAFDTIAESMSVVLAEMIADTDSATDAMLALWKAFSLEVTRILAKLAAEQLAKGIPGLGGGEGGGGGGSNWFRDALGWAVTILPWILKPGAGTGQEEAPSPPSGEGVTEFVGQVLEPRPRIPRSDFRVGRRLPAQPAENISISIKQFDTESTRRSLSSGNLRREVLRLGRLRRL